MRFLNLLEDNISIRLFDQEFIIRAVPATRDIIITPKNADGIKYSGFRFTTKMTERHIMKNLRISAVKDPVLTRVWREANDL